MTYVAFISVSTHFLKQVLLNTYYVPGTVLRTGEREQQNLCPRGLAFCFPHGLRGSRVAVLLGCTPAGCKPCAFPASREKKGPGVSDRDINGLMDGDGGLTCLKQGSGAPPHHVRQT